MRLHSNLDATGKSCILLPDLAGEAGDSKLFCGLGEAEDKRALHTATGNMEEGRGFTLKILTFGFNMSVPCCLPEQRAGGCNFLSFELPFGGLLRPDE